MNTSRLWVFLVAALVGCRPVPRPGTGGGEDAGPTGATADAGRAWDAGRLDDGGGADAAASCHGETVTPYADCAGDGFVPDGPTAAWRHTGTSLWVVTQGAPRHRGVDMVVNPGQEQWLVAKFAYGPADKDLVDEDVEVWVRAACGSWAKLATVATSDDGSVTPPPGYVDDGGRVFYAVPADLRLGVGSHQVRMLVKGDHSQARFWLHVWPPGTHAVVTDTDGTITTSETDGLWTAFNPDSAQPRPHAAEMLHAYASKGYRVLYLTARPEFLTEATRGWYADRGFPWGVVHLSQTDFGVQSAAAAAYKGAYLTALAQQQGVVVDWAYGNKESDLQAYTGAGIPPSHVFLFAGEYQGPLDGAHRLESYAPERDRARCLPVVAQP